MQSAVKTEASAASRTITRARNLIAAFQTVRQTMPIQIAATFLLVAQFEGRSAREYMDITGLSEATMSRHLLDLGVRNRNKEPGYGLIEQSQNPEDMRKNVYKLTAKGRSLLRIIEGIMER